MSKFAVIGDLHLDDKVPGYLDFQVKTINKIIEESECEEIVFLGDIFEYRRPNPECLLAWDNIIQGTSKNFLVIRGNHDAINKSDNGRTVLSLFHDTAVFTHPGKIKDFHFIPHYEDNNKIREYLKAVNKYDFIFGHFGYKGVMYSMDHDETINLKEIKAKTILGHIHHYNVNANVTCLGTPYPTMFTEANKQNFYAIVDRKTHDIEIRSIDHGIRYFVTNLDSIDLIEGELKNPNYFPLLRINLESITDQSDVFLKEKIKVKYNLPYVEVKSFDLISENLSSYPMDKKTKKISKNLIQAYVDGANTLLDQEDLSDGLKQINNYLKEDD